MKKNNPFIAAFFFGVVFLLLIGVRTGAFNKEKIPANQSMEEIKDKNTWMNIYQNGKKIGHSHRVIHTTPKGYAITDSTFMRINMMGMVEDISFETNGELNEDFSLTRFNFELKASLFEFNVYGTIRDKTLIAYIDGQKTEIPLKETIYMSTGFLDAVIEEGFKPGETKTIHIFDPSTMGQRPVKITDKGETTIKIMGKRISATKFTIDLLGAKQTAWVDKNGEIVREEGFMGISLEKVSRYEALDKIPGKPDEDITKSVSIASNKKIENSEALSSLRLMLSDYGDTITITGGRQIFIDDILTITKEAIPEGPYEIPPKVSTFLAPTTFIQSESTVIKELVRTIVKPTDSPYEKMTKLIGWVDKNIKKRPVLSMPSAIEILKNKMGDCNEHAVLLCALARAAGIPAKIESGLVYMKDRFYYHAWNLVYLGDWVTCDATMSQIPADVTHIRLITGGTDKQIDLISIIGKIKLTILEQS